MSPFSSPTSHSAQNPRKSPAEGEPNIPSFLLQHFPAHWLDLGTSLSSAIFDIFFLSKNFHLLWKGQCWVLKLGFFQSKSWGCLWNNWVRQFLMNITLNVISSQKMHICMIIVIILFPVHFKIDIHLVTIFDANSDCSRSRFSVDWPAFMAV